MVDTPDAGLEEQTRDGDKLREVHKRAIVRFDDAVLPQQEQRELALTARRFVSIPGAQWEGEWGDMFENSVKLEINKVAAGLDKIERDYRENRIVPDFRPAGGDADAETANALDGIHRADSYHFKSQQARDNAFIEAAAGGFGAYRLTTEWADPYDKDSDEQRINPGLVIVDADQRVYFDPNSKLYDKSDARFAFVLTAMTVDAFEGAYADDDGAAPPTTWQDPTQRGSTYDWYLPDTIIVAEYYEVEERDEKLWIFTLRATGEEQRWWNSEIEADEVQNLKDMGWHAESRRQTRRRVHKYVLSGQDVLEDQGLITGCHIPIVPVYGKRWYIDNQERFRGYVQAKMDAQRLYNAKVSKLAETDSLAPREIPIFAREQMPQGLADQWARQNVDRHAYALVEPLYGPNGELIAAGPIGKVEPPQVPPVTAALLQVAANDLAEDMADTDEVKANTSAAAMDIASTRIDAKSGLYLDNMAQSVQREGEIYLGMARDCYWEPGRVLETMSEDGDDGEAVIAQTVEEDGALKIRNDFTRGRYKVIAGVTETTATRRDKTVKSALNTASVAMQAGDQDLAQASVLTAVMNQDGEGMDDLQRYARQKGLKLGLVEPNEEEQKAMAQAAQGQQPDPAAAALLAQAQKDAALAGKAEADTGLSKAKTVETLAKASAAGAPANDVAPPRPMIRMGRDLGQSATA